MIGLWVAVAFAGGVHTGIPVRGVEGIGEPSFLTPESGWSAGVDGGWVRVFVGETEADAEDWYRRAVATVQVPPPPLSFVGDEAAGDGTTLVVLRDGNVALMVRSEGSAGEVARRLHGAIVDGGPERLKPSLVVSGGTWSLDAPGMVAVRATGGRPVPFRTGSWTAPPSQLVVWDAWGRPAVVR